MKKALLVLTILALTGWAYADFPGSPISGGGGDSLPSQTGNSGKVLTTDGSNASWGSATTSLPWDNITGTDNSITSAKIQDNAIAQRHIKFPTTGGYVRIWSPAADSVRYNMFKADGTIIGRFELDDTGDVYLKSIRASDSAFVGSLEFDPVSFATFLSGAAGTWLRITGHDNVGITPPLYLTVPLGVASGGTGSDNAAGARTNLGLGTMATQASDNVQITGGTISGVTGLGTGTVTGPATATADNVVTWGADNTTIKDSGVALSALATLAAPTFTGVPAAPTAAADTNTTQIATTAYVIGQGYAKLVSPSFTTPTLGVASATTLNTGQGAYELYAMDQNVQTTDNVTFNTVSAGEFISTAADNTRGATIPNTAAPTGANLAPGKGWYNITSNMVEWAGSDNAVRQVFTSGAAHTLNFATTGTLTGGIMILDNVSGPSAAQMYGSLNLVNANITVLLPTAVAGMSGCVTDGGATHDNVIVDVQAGDNVILVGVTQAGGVGITNASGTSLGDYVCLIATAANKWRVYGKVGTWVSQ